MKQAAWWRLGVIGMLVWLTPAHAVEAVERRHVILVVVDGSQLAHEVVVSQFLEGRPDGLVVHGFPYHGRATTWDLSTLGKRAQAAGIDLSQASRPNPIWGYDPNVEGLLSHPDVRAEPAVEARLVAAATDGAAAATALSTGVKTVNGRLAWGSQEGGGARTTLWEQAAEQGRSIGVVSSVPFVHATPAAFVAHHFNHAAYHDIAAEILYRTRPTVVIGAGHPDPDGDGVANFRWVSEAIWNRLTADESIELVESGAAATRRLAASTQQSIERGVPLIGVFGHAARPDQAGDRLLPPVPLATADGLQWGIDDRDPMLADAAEAALRRLAVDPEGFALLVEAGDVDWANQADDLEGLVQAWAAADNTIARIVSLVASGSLPGVNPGNTLVLVTAGHGNGLLRLRPDYAVPEGTLPRVDQVPFTADFLAEWPEHLDAVYPAMPDGSPLERNTNELVTVYAWGAGLDLLLGFEGAWYPGTRLLDHVHVHAAMAAFLGLGPRPVGR